jgi:hypothetical protein
MGRDKTPKPAAAAVEIKPEVVIGLDGRPQRPPRGKIKSHLRRLAYLGFNFVVVIVVQRRPVLRYRGIRVLV